MPDELSHGDLLSHSVVQAVTVEDHALQDGERALQDGHVHHGLVHVACDLGVDREDEETSVRLWKLRIILRAQHFSLSESCSYTGNNVCII